MLFRVVEEPSVARLVRLSPATGCSAAGVCVSPPADKTLRAWGLEKAMREEWLETAAAFLIKTSANPYGKIFLFREGK
jgi:hypothetical protein